MKEDTLRTLETLLGSRDPVEVRRGLALAREHLSSLDEKQARTLLEMLSALFYIDPLDRPDLVPNLEEAISVVASLGKWTIPILVENLEAGDMKAQMAIAQALGRMGAEAIGPLRAEYESCPEHDCRAFILFALGKVKSPKIVKAVPLALEAAGSPDVELRDTATRAIGKFVESIPPADLPGDLRAALVARVRANLSDSNSGVRAKAVRSLGKLARYGHLTADERVQLKTTLQRLLGEDEDFDWDRAYVVRREAKEALGYVTP